MADGFSLTIDDSMLKKLDDADKKLAKLADTMDATSKRMIKSFQDINSQGLDVFMNKINDVNKVISSLGNKKISISSILGGKSQTAKSVDDINKLIELLNKLSQETKKTQGANKRGGLFGDMSKSVSDWQALQKQISDNEKQISKLTQSTREYESTMKRIQSGKGGVIHGGASKEYQENLKNIESLKQQNASLQQKQQLIIQNNQAIQAQANLQQQLKQYNQQQGSLPEQRKADELKRMNDYYRELEKSSKKAADEATKAANKETEARNRAERASKKQAEAEAKRQQRAAQSRETQILNAYNQAMKANEATVNQRINKLAKLRQVESQLAQDEAKYSSQLSRVRSEIDRLSQANDKAAKSTKQLQNNQRSLMDTAGQLQRKLALLFSVSAIQGYVSKLIDVRGEFEMQQRSLQVLLQNKDQANELWDKTVALAVKSPFRVKELVTYTKQLAAYRVEADKLFETNKMLADVSAGLGVDMNRLILAFGQVKAANYLRGTELRQFSEAGVNMLGELAQYFTELEGRAVSVGDVFERVSKRMVTFQDVNAIFQRITSESGVFYQMQEKQSETLRGMVMNFRDSMDLMLNDIGKSQDSILKDSIRLAKEFVDNWRDFSAIINTAGVAFLAAFGTKSLLGIAKGLKNLFSFISANPWVALAGAVALVFTYLYQAADAQNKLNAAMQEVDNENIATLEENISLYHQLVETINDATKSYEDRNKALSQLKQKFNDILPDQYTELEYVQQLGDNYRDAEDAMMNYYNAKAIEQKKSRVEQNFVSEIEGTDIPELIDSYKKFIEGYNAIGIDESKAQIKLKAGISGIINSVVQDIKSGQINVNDIQKEISKRLELFVGEDEVAKHIISWAEEYGDIEEDISDIIDTLERYNKALANIQGLPYETYDQLKASEMINKEKLNVEQATRAFKKAASLYEQYVNAIPKVDKSVKQQREEIEKDVQKILTDLPESLNAYSEYLKGVFAQLKENADTGKFNFKASLQAIESDLYALRDESGKLTGGLAKIAFDNVVLNENANDSAKQMIKNFQEGLDEQGKKLKMSTFQKSVNEGIKKIADRFDVSADVFAKFVPATTDALSTVRQKVKAEIDSIESRIKEFQTSLTQGMYILSEGALDETKKGIEEMSKQLPALKAFFTFLGGDLDKNKKGGRGRSNSLYDERIKVIDDMNKKYKELNKTLEKSEALQGAFNAYIDAFATAYQGVSWIPKNVQQMSPQEFASKVLNFPNENALVSFLDKLAKEPMKTFEKIKVELAKGEYVYDMKVRVKSEDDKDLLEQIEKMFSGYEMSIELQKLNIPPDLAKQLFNIDALTLPELKSKVVSMKSQFVGTDMEEEYRKFLKKIDEMEEKAQVERLKKYTKYLVKAQGERVKIKMDEMRQLNEIETLNFTDAQKELARQAIKKESQQKMDKLEWEDFKDSGMYVQLFEDLEYVSTNALMKMREKLSKLKTQLKDLDADDLKHLYSQIEKLDNEISTRNPYKYAINGIDDYINAIKNAKQLEENLLSAQSRESGLKNQEANISKELAIEQSKFKTIKQNLNASSDDVNKQYMKVKELESQLSLVRAQLIAQGKLTDEIEEQLDANKQIRKTFTGNLAEIGSVISEAASALPNIASDLENVFGAMDDGARDAIDSIATIGAGVGDAIQGFASGNYIQAIAGVAKALGGIFAIGDKKKERQIQREIKFVENLERAYEKLEKQIDAAYTIDTLKKSYDAAQKNIDAQIASYNKMIAAEEDKKKTDKDRIKEWQQTIEDLSEQRKELLKSQVEELGGGYDYSSMTEEFVNAWLDAFKETGNGLTGLEDNFEEFWQNIAIKQAVMGGASKIMQPFLDAVNKALENDFKLDDSEMANIDNLSAKAKEDMNAFLEQWYNRWGDFMEQGEQGELSGLQRGISGITESQADILAAYANSCRFFLANIDTTLASIANQILGGGNMPNPILSELRTQTELVRGISTLLNSVVRGSHSMGGQGIKVFIS